jgi:hypothetical protein
VAGKHALTNSTRDAKHYTENSASFNIGQTNAARNRKTLGRRRGRSASAQQLAELAAAKKVAADAAARIAELESALGA